MARNGKSRKSSKPRNLEPAAMTLTFAWDARPEGLGPVAYLDLSQIASLVNRRFYRQGLNWAVAGMKFLVQAGAGQIGAYKLPNSWVMANSWEKSMRTWMKMNRETLEETESIRPRFLDFKIYSDIDHHLAGFGANLLPVSQPPHPGPPLPYTVGEWEPSKMIIPVGALSPGVTASREFIAVGGNYPGLGASGLDAVSLIEGYAASRGLPNVLDPNAPADAASVDGFNPDNWLAATFNEGTSQIEQNIELMIDENNIAPYPFENDGVHIDTQYPGGANQGTGLEIHDIAFVTATTIGGATRLKGGNFPCGLIKLQTDIASQIVLQIDMIPGNHRGYLAESMTEM